MHLPPLLPAPLEPVGLHGTQHRWLPPDSLMMAACELDEERLHQLLLAAVQAGTSRRGGWAAPLLLLALSAALGAAAYLTWRHRQQERRRLEAAASVADGENIARFCNVLPAWCAPCLPPLPPPTATTATQIPPPAPAAVRCNAHCWCKHLLHTAVHVVLGPLLPAAGP